MLASEGREERSTDRTDGMGVGQSIALLLLLRGLCLPTPRLPGAEGELGKMKRQRGTAG